MRAAVASLPQSEGSQLERPGVRMVAKQLSVHHIAGHYVHQALPRYVVANVTRCVPHIIPQWDLKLDRNHSDVHTGCTPAPMFFQAEFARRQALRLVA